MNSSKYLTLLSAFSAHRWLESPPLPRLEQYLTHPTSTPATEGTAVHALGECNIHRALSHKFKWPISDYQSDILHQ